MKVLLNKASCLSYEQEIEVNTLEDFIKLQKEHNEQLIIDLIGKYGHPRIMVYDAYIE